MMTALVVIALLVGIGVLLWATMVLRAVDRAITRIDSAFGRTERALRRIAP